MIKDFAIYKSGDQIRKKIEARFNLEQLDPKNNMIEPTERAWLEVIHRNIEGAVRYKLTAEELFSFGF